ncbi:TRM10 tRNA [Candida maltosa Xu316]|uniref:tRNA (guanine(9)-N1)-methyltransferase n=1 Tax=Candida maltosa (strain Xu316) TaxID=1245528 RepID=M3K670_CANMX|nr:hypothetical protein G210_1250 [Candida maltosa Xu316]
MSDPTPEPTTNTPPVVPKPRGQKPTPEEIEERRKLKKLQVLPEGISRKEWKRQQKRERWEESKEKYQEINREKKRLARQRKRIRLQEDEELRLAKRKPTKKIETDVKVIIDCDFDELMLDKEIVSLSNQLKHCYSIMRRATFNLPVTVTSFNKRLKDRFEESLSDYHLWVGNMEFTDKSLTEVGDINQMVYLTADTEEEITKLEPNHTYIIGGIVDKNRHKHLCYKKAKELGIKVARLPIGKYIEVNGRHVLVTSHVYELLCKLYETGGDWEQAFNKVLPPRKIRHKDDTPTVESESKEPESEEEPESDKEEA